MKQKLLDLLEKHVDKLILGVIAIVALMLLWVFVIGNPYGAEYNRKIYSPGKIDSVIKKDSLVLDQRVNGPATEPYPIYKGNKAGLYAANMSSTVDVKDNIIIPMAVSDSNRTEDKRFYRKPSIPPVADIDAEVIRTAVFVPTEKVSMSMPYEQAKTDISDIDFITVQASFDTSELYKSFKNSFVNSASSEYKDEELAVPIFASVGLERQVLDADGNWSDWEVVKRPSIDRRSEMFVVPDKAQDIKLGGIDVLLMNFEKFEVQKDLLQPVAFDIAASNAQWLTPTYHKEFVELIEKEMEISGRDASGRLLPGSVRSNENYMGGGEFGMMNPGVRPGVSARPTVGGSPESPGKEAGTRRPTAGSPRRDRTIEVIRKDFEFLFINKDDDLSIMKDPLVFWAFDEDIEPTKSYRYRMRLGVFNPTAGKGWFGGSDAEFNDDVVLWSEYSGVTAPIEIDPMVYFFPINVAKRSKAATIQVSKFQHGKWQSQEFDVKIGEPIGKLVEIEVKENPADKRERSKTVEEVKTVDFSSGAILVDIVESKRSLSGGRSYQEILYSENGEFIKHLGITKRNWTKALSSTFNDIADQKDMIVRISEMRSQSGMGNYPGGMYPGGGPGFEGREVHMGYPGMPNN